MKSEAITLIIALWGAFLATVTFGWNLLRDLSDKGKLRVSCYMGKVVIPGVVTKDNLLVWNVTNVGRQPIILKDVGGEYMDKTNFLITQEALPLMLKPGGYFTGWTDKPLTVSEEKLKSLTAIDSVGRTYKAPRKQFKKVKGDLKKLRAGQKLETNQQVSGITCKWK